MGLSQDKIHSTVLNFLGITESEGLRIIGDWFFKFLISKEQKMSLIIPIYKTDLTKNAYLYVRAFYHIYYLLIFFNKSSYFFVSTRNSINSSSSKSLY